MEGKRTGEATGSCKANLCYTSSVFICLYNTITTVHPAVENLDIS